MGPLDPELKKQMDEITNGVSMSVLNSLKHSTIAAHQHPIVAMTVYLSCFNLIARGAPKEAHAMVIEILEANLEMLRDAWGIKPTPKGPKPEESRIILPFK